jgi:DNA-binding beta-propeller fold protein YncE
VFAFNNPPASGTAAGFALALTGGNAAETYDIANASYDNVSFSVASQEATPFGLFFKPDGTKMYITGWTSPPAVAEYDLSTTFDISTASHVQDFSVTTQETNPTGVFFKDDGTKMYVVGQASDNVNEYNLSTAWNISTASYSQNFSVASQDVTPRGLYFNNNGTKFFITGALGDDVSEYSLSTAWDISTASFTTDFNFTSQETNSTALSFNSDGTKMYVIGYTNDTVFEYNLGTAFDVSTASYNSVSFSVASQDTAPAGITFNNTGTKMYIIGQTNDTIYQYTTGSTSTATFTYPSAVKFPSGTAPAGPAIDETDVLVFYTDDGGTTYQGFRAGDAMA